jgi:hypothetical protein
MTFSPYATDLENGARWLFHQCAGDSGAGLSYWQEHPEFRKLQRALLTAERDENPDDLDRLPAPEAEECSFMEAAETFLRSLRPGAYSREALNAAVLGLVTAWTALGYPEPTRLQVLLGLTPIITELAS